MSKLLQENSLFLRFFLKADKAQKLAILATLSNAQTRVLTEIFHNLWQIPHESDSVRGLVQQKRATLLKLGNSRAKINSMKTIFWHHRRQVIEILQLFRQPLEALLSSAE